MRSPKYHLYLTHDERRTVINSLICLKNDLISQETTLFHKADIPMLSTN